MVKLLPLVIMITAGILVPVQTGINASLRNYAASPILSSLISFVVGTISLSLLFALGVEGRGNIAALQMTPLWAFTGGIIGAFYVTVLLMFAPQLGSTVTTIAVLAGQVVSSLVIDHFGLLGFPVTPISPLRVLGAILVIGGLLVIQIAR